VTSAGTRPKASVHPAAFRVLREEFGIDLGDRRPQSLDRVADRRFDHVITVCDRAREVCPDLGAPGRSIHWSIPDPGASEASDQYPAFTRVAHELDTRICQLLPVLAGTEPTEVDP
jgi:protein-tyrosine-phosphatase